MKQEEPLERIIGIVSQSVSHQVCFILSLEIRTALQTEEFCFASNSINWYEARTP